MNIIKEMCNDYFKEEELFLRNILNNTERKDMHL